MACYSKTYEFHPKDFENYKRNLLYFNSSRLFIAEYCMIQIYRSLSDYSPTEEYLGYFQFLPILNKAFINICIQVYV